MKEKEHLEADCPDPPGGPAHPNKLCCQKTAGGGGGGGEGKTWELKSEERAANLL